MTTVSPPLLRFTAKDPLLAAENSPVFNGSGYLLYLSGV
jgi:hypothetical protein